MPNPDHLAILKQGVDTWNEWRRENPDVQPDLSGLQFHGWTLSDFDLCRINLYASVFNKGYLLRTKFDEADMQKASFYGMIAQQATFSGTHLGEAVCQGCTFAGSRFEGAFLGRTYLCECSLVGADLTDVHLNETAIVAVDLRHANGLERCVHHAPSTLDHRTLTQSGKLPLPFLRGCGLPEQLIDYIPSLLGSAIEFYSCFISYSTKDQAFAERLHADLQAKGVRCWFAPHDIQGGKKIHEQIDRAIQVHDRLLLILSEHSMGSEWVKTEIAHARQKEVEQKRRVLFPIRLVDMETIRRWECFDADTGKDSAREIREYHIPDFSNRKDHDSYPRAFERLLKDLRAEERERADSLAEEQSDPT